ncbi:unnamed protein product [Urochloa decumbens]|uniref:Alpha-carbonic anhydrase domain-containing protein n=1 Tax=Urochloa decumbens TaxID=240449 RepID=A0ABC9C1J5_9POAL
MGSPARRHLRLAVAAVLLLIISAAATAQVQEETDEELKFSYVRGDERGPERWGELDDSWANCSAGRMQSPIDLHHERVSLVRGLGYLSHSYRPAQASIHNRGHDIMVTFEGDAGDLVIDGTAYRLKQLHWHSPAEHTVDGRRYDMELHLVHESAPPANETAVVGLLYEVGAEEDPFLRRLEHSIRAVADTNNTEDVGVVDPRGVRGRTSVYYRYMGSLTTPPCTEGVVSTVVKRVRTVSKYQLELLREAVHDNMENNTRPLQEVNDRDISIFRPKPHRH